MKKIILKSLELKNFKGIKDLKIDFEEDITNIHGANATGKTTVFDAFAWLMWDKESTNKSDFNIKTFNEDGSQITNQEHSVEGSFLIDGKSIVLKKIYKELWTTKRGSQNEEFNGHTTDHFIDGVPKSKKEYTDRLNAIAPEEDLKTLSNLMYFNVFLKKNERRERLMSLIDTVTDEDVVKLDKSFKELDLENYSIDDLQKMNKATIKKINKEREEIPVRIDELLNSKKEYNFEELEFKKNILIPGIRKIDEELATNDNSEYITEISKQIDELIREKHQLILATDETNRDEKAKVDEVNRELERKKNELESSIKVLDRDIEHREKQLLETEQSIEELRQEYLREYTKKYDGSDICPVCNQELPEEMIAEAGAKFNLEKSKKLENITKRANIKASEIESYKEGIELLLRNKKKHEEELEEVLNTPKSEYTPIEYPARVEGIEQELEELKVKLSDTSSNNGKAILLEKKEGQQKELDEINSKLAYKEHNTETDKKIEEYAERQKDLAVQFEEAQKILFLCEEFIREKTELISKEINNKFNLVGFKLFENQINGGLLETCEATINGVPFADANNAAKINAGIDIINTLSKHIGIQAPIFVDNAESVNELIPTDCQVIRLVVSEDKELRVE